MVVPQQKDPQTPFTTGWDSITGLLVMLLVSASRPRDLQGKPHRTKADHHERTHLAGKHSRQMRNKCPVQQRSQYHARILCSRPYTRQGVVVGGFQHCERLMSGVCIASVPQGPKPHSMMACTACCPGGPWIACSNSASPLTAPFSPAHMDICTHADAAR